MTITLSEDQFDNDYPLLDNPYGPDGGWHIELSTKLFGTTGDEFRFVAEQNPACVWTLVNGDDGTLWLLSGLWMVNRLGYLVSTRATPANASFQVRLSH
ncbi:MAG: hypothetical protein ACRC8S_13640 [Fimbriiglobus sp.]